MKYPWTIGRRVVKTGVAVFISTILCITFNVSASFAIISSIVTIEPTVYASVKKSIVRLPATAIGSFFAISCDLLLGETALTYALVAIFTITACTLFKLDRSTLVATLSATAMIPGMIDPSYLDILFRLSGSFIGITVSTIVNFFFLPPKFGPILVQKINTISNEMSATFEFLLLDIMKEEQMDRKQKRLLLVKNNSNQILKAFDLLQYQRDEWRFRASSSYERRSFDYLQKKLEHIHHLSLHLGKIAHLRLNHTISQEQRSFIKQVIQSYKSIMIDPLHQMNTEHMSLLVDIKKMLKHSQPNSSLTIDKIMYELDSIHSSLEELAQITKDERFFSTQEKNYPDYVFAFRYVTKN
ncbi:FUSC family protein [Alkalihalobacillus trypoxylicola]|uniref:Aromatic acid exporter family protein n=1 Tax=Alkalihalobacillus trypoxylicola TaxID=519424 RepID=A0A162FBN2_9BACI|nr:aromatic acid exporter family protein [Alkalihalobacillus trypoxylicola]KYG35228.1 hypothetical protein AZF04_02500 [Alkalihalobacillus trypoxylicola]GAF63916.1 hypothetical protein BTS2_0808 [Bacillus sp. TS-2]